MLVLACGRDVDDIADLRTRTVRILDPEFDLVEGRHSIEERRCWPTLFRPRQGINQGGLQRQQTVQERRENMWLHTSTEAARA